MDHDFTSLYEHLKITHVSLDNIDVVFYITDMVSDADGKVLRATAAHEHAWYELHCVRKGYAEIKTDEKTYIIKANEALFLPPRTYHISKTSEGNTLSLCLGFELSDNGKSTKENLYQTMSAAFSTATCIRIKNCSSIAALTQELLEYFNKGGNIGDCRSHNLLSRFLFLLSDKLLQKKTNTKDAVEPLLTNPNDNLNYLLDHLTSKKIDNMTLEELSQKLYLSKKQINKIIKRRYHTTYKQKQIRFRMENAKKLLSETTLPIEAISQQVGYTNLTSFYKNFEKIIGMTPATYRKSLKK